MPSIFDINKYCLKKKCQNSSVYTKITTSGNNPQISEKMRYAQYIRQYQIPVTK